MNIEVHPPDRLTSYRKIAIASWRHPRDPTTYSWVDLPVSAAEKFLQSVDAKVKPTLTHFVAMVLGDCLNRQPEFNRLLRMGRLHPRKTTDAFITTLLRKPEGKDLSGFRIGDITSKSIMEVAEESAAAAEQLRKGEDREMEAVARRIDKVSARILRVILAVQEFFAYRLNWNSSWLGMPKDRFGSFMISNVGALGLDRALIPLSPYTRCPVIIGLGRVREEAVVRDGEIAAERVITMSMTFDHRYADGAQGAMVMRRFQKIFANPEGFLDVFGMAG